MPDYVVPGSLFYVLEKKMNHHAFCYGKIEYNFRNNTLLFKNNRIKSMLDLAETCTSLKFQTEN